MMDAEQQAKTRFERLSLPDSPHPALRATFPQGKAIPPVSFADTPLKRGAKQAPS